MSKQKNLKVQLKEFEAGKYEAPDFKTQCAAGWYDWFCKDKSLANKTKTLFSALKSFLKVVPVDLTTRYVFFKNNCPAGWGGLYDDFRICDLKSGDVIWTVSPRKPDGEGGFVYSVWGAENDFNEAIIEGTRSQVFDFFRNRKNQE
jgi:hypothetical protein